MPLFPRDDVSSRYTSAPSRGEPRLLTRRDTGEDEGTSEPESRRIVLKKSAPRRRWYRWPLRILSTAAFLLIIAVLVAAAFLRHDMRASLPQIDGELHVAGLAAPVTVARDEHGIPTIRANTLDDLLFAQGYVTAQDRLWQMDALRRHASGNLAELLGPSLVLHDRTQRTLQLRATADRGVASLPPDQRHQLEMYAAGVNAFIAQNADHLPVEFHLLHYTPAPWTPRDSLLVSLAMFQDLSTGFPTKLARETLSAHLAPELLPDLYPVGSWRDHPPGDTGPDLTSIKPETKPVPLDDSQVLLHAPTPPPTSTPQAMLALEAALPHASCEGCRSGSNNWAVAGARSASGKPIVSNDMHLNLSVPDIWYEASLHTADGTMDVAGVTLPGVPFLIVGRNAHVAWGFTAMMGDVQDVYIEHLRGSGDSAEYQRTDGSWAPVLHQHEHITVRGGRDVDFDIQLTAHTIGSNMIPTPIISPLLHGEKRALALAWSAYQTPMDIPFLTVDSADSGAALAQAFNHFVGPPLNLVYGDDQNHIGYHAIGYIPIRGPAVQHAIAQKASEPSADNDATTSAPPPSAHFTIGSPIPAVPVDALDADAAWSGYVPYDAMPTVVDPPSGLLVTANSRITPDGYPYSLAIDWFAPYRTERINHLLATRTGLTPADLLHTEMDIHSEFDLLLAQRLAYAIDHASKHALERNPKRLREAADILRRWNGNVDANASAPSIVLAARTALWPMLLVPQIAEYDRTHPTSPDLAPLDIAALYTWGEQTDALEQLVTSQPTRWLPREYKSWNDLLADAVLRGLDQQHAPGDLARWAWGPAHPVDLSHPLLSMSPLIGYLLVQPTGTGPHSTGGDSTTIKQTGRTFGPSERFTADLSSPAATIANLTTGQSGNPDSRWYLDQFPLWLNGRSLALPLTTNTPTHTLTLLP